MCNTLQEARFKPKLMPLNNLVKIYVKFVESSHRCNTLTGKDLFYKGPGAYNPDTIDMEWNRPTYNITIATEMEKR